MFNSEKLASRTNNSSAVQNTIGFKTKSQVSSRNKLHKVTELKEQDVLALAQFTIDSNKELERLKKSNRKALQFLSEKGLLHEFQDFINAKSA